MRNDMPHNRYRFELELQRTWPIPNLMAGSWTDSAGAVVQCESEPRGSGPFSASLLGTWRSAPDQSEITVSRLVVRDTTIEIEMSAADDASAAKAKAFSGTYHRLPDERLEVPAADGASVAPRGNDDDGL